MLLAGKSAVVTGSTSGIGLGIARAGSSFPLLGSGRTDPGAALPVDGG